MKTIRTLVKAVAGTVAVLGVAYLFYFGGEDLFRRPPPAPPAPPAPTASTAVPASPPLSSAAALEARPDFAAIVEAVKPAVVNVSTTQATRGRGPRPADPFREFLERQFGEGRPREEPRQSLGSGLIVEADGYVLTNNHVIENAGMIMVRLSDEEEYEARVVGRDPRTDLALLKIQGRREFATVKLGDSDRLRVGEWVLAIGNPGVPGLRRGGLEPEGGVGAPALGSSPGRADVRFHVRALLVEYVRTPRLAANPLTPRRSKLTDIDRYTVTVAPRGDPRESLDHCHRTFSRAWRTRISRGETGAGAEAGRSAP